MSEGYQCDECLEAFTGGPSEVVGAGRDTPKDLCPDCLQEEEKDRGKQLRAILDNYREHQDKLDPQTEQYVWEIVIEMLLAKVGEVVLEDGPGAAPTMMLDAIEQVEEQTDRRRPIRVSARREWAFVDNGATFEEGLLSLSMAVMDYEEVGDE